MPFMLGLDSDRAYPGLSGADIWLIQLTSHRRIVVDWSGHRGIVAYIDATV